MKRSLASLLALVGLTAVITSALDAAKPAPPPPANTATGIIFHTRNGQNYAVRPDDTGLTAVAGAGPCFYAQGSNPFHDRWHLTLQQTGEYDLVTYVSASTGQVVTNGPWPHFDLFAYRSVPGNPSQLEYVQLTDLFGILRIPNADAWRGLSSDTNELSTSFVAVRGRDIRSTFTDVDGETWYDHRESPEHDLRLPLTAGEITDGWLNQNFVPYPGDQLDTYLRPIHSAQILPVNQNGVHLGFTLSGRKAYLVDPDNPDLNNPISIVWDGSTGEPSNLNTDWQNDVPSVAPNGLKVAAINWHSDSRGGVWVLSLDGSSPPKQITQNAVKGNSSTKFDTVFFSPDSQHILTRRVTFDPRASWKFDQVIYPANGGTAVKTFANSPMWVTRWVSANTAP